MADAVPGDSFLVDFAADVETLHERLQRCLGDARVGHGTGWMFAALWLLKSPDSPTKVIAGAVPRTGEFSVRACVEAMANLGFFAAGPRRRHRSFRQKELPLLLVEGDGTPCIIFSDRDGRRLWRAYGPDLISEVSRASALDDATAVYSFRKDRQDISMAQSWRQHRSAGWFRALLGKFPTLVISVSVLSIALALVTLLYPVLTILTYLQVIGLGSLSSLPMMALGMLIVVGLELVGLQLRSRAVGWLAARLEYLVGVESLQQMLRLKPGIIERAAVTDQVARIRSFESVREFITGPMFMAILDLPMTLAGVVAIAILAPAILPTMLGAVVAFGLLLFVLLQFNRVVVRLVADEATRMQAAAIETFEKQVALRQAGLTDIWMSRMARLVRREQKALFRLRLLAGGSEAGSTLVFNVSIALAVAAGTVAIWQGELSAQVFLAIIILFVRAMSPMHIMCLSVQRAEQLKNAVGQINALFELEAEETAERPRRTGSHFDGSVTFVNAGFRAADTRPVFVGLDQHVEPGRIVAVTGATGSGKTTLLRLIHGAMETSVGTIRMNGIDLRQFPTDELRGNVSFVSQNPHLLPGTLAENLRFALPEADDETLRRAAALVGLDRYLDLAQGGLEADLDAEARSRVSLEFKFQVALAQAVLSNNRIILIDDIPNELLEGRLGDILRLLIEKSRGHRTLFFVSARSDFLSLADTVIAMRYGGVPLVAAPQAILERAA